MVDHEHRQLHKQDKSCPLNGLIFDSTYGSYSPLSTLDTSTVCEIISKTCDNILSGDNGSLEGNKQIY